MSNVNGFPDKNLSNVVEQLEERPVNAHHAQQIQQQRNDHRHQASLNHDGSVEQSNPKS